MVECLFANTNQFSRFKGFGEYSVNSQCFDSVVQLGIGIGSDKYDGQEQKTWILTQEYGQLHAVDVGHVHIQDHQVRVELCRLLQAMQWLLDANDLHTGIAQNLTFQCCHVGVVVHYHHFIGAIVLGNDLQQPLDQQAHIQWFD